jgi:hypothetical protein
LKEAGLSARQYEGTFQRQVVSNLAVAVRECIPRARSVTHVGLGDAKVEKVASNRRIHGPDGKVRAVRYTSTKDPALRAEPEGTIDPIVSLVSFWDSEQPVAVLSFYATHPQSYYRTGIPNPDFPGLARFLRQLAVPSALHVHFNGAGGNIGAGKYNDGSPENRLILAQRLADGMRRAWESTKRQPILAADVAWATEPIKLSPGGVFRTNNLEAQIKEGTPTFMTTGGGSRLAWLRRCQSGHQIDVACLKLGAARVLYVPGEAFVEYQLAAKGERTGQFVAVAAYGDYGPWYIGTAVAYDEGGYETSPGASNVGPDAEPILMAAIRKLLRQ